MCKPLRAKNLYLVQSSQWWRLVLSSSFLILTDFLFLQQGPIMQNLFYNSRWCWLLIRDTSTLAPVNLVLTHSVPPNDTSNFSHTFLNFLNVFDKVVTVKNSCNVRLYPNLYLPTYLDTNTNLLTYIHSCSLTYILTY